MTWLWWLANGVFLLVVIPAVVLLLHRLREPVIEIRRYVDDVLEHGQLLTASMDAVDELAETRDRIRTLKEQVGTYGRSLESIL